MIRTPIKGPFRVLPRLVDQIRLVEKRDKVVLVEFRKKDQPTRSRGIFVFGSAEEAGALSGHLDEAAGRDAFIDALRDANYALCVPAVDCEDDVALYGYPTFAPDVLKAMLQRSGLDASIFVPKTLDGFSVDAYWSEIKPETLVVPEKAFERTTRNRVMRKTGATYMKERYSNRAGPIPLELKNRYLEALHNCGSNLEKDPLPVSPYETAVKLDELRERSIRPSPAQVRYARAIARTLGIEPPFDLLKTNRFDIAAFIKKHHPAMQKHGKSRSAEADQRAGAGD